MKFVLKNGTRVDIREVQNTSLTASDFRKFIAEILREKPEPFLQMDRQSIPSLKEEKKWLLDKKKRIAKRNEITLVAIKGKQLVGTCDARLGIHRNRDKVSIGVSVAAKYRGLGLGKKLLREIIKLAEKKLKPRIIYLSVIAENKSAYKLYKKLGFREIARLPKWLRARGKYHDEVYMVLK
ncbi:GNAT family N-acetyltransferase [Candidatus Micrarchaeota archaeon]|nr:GNAT family N-acetyltransferase [Candidatus Micrarchaeota archaeon]